MMHSISLLYSLQHGRLKIKTTAEQAAEKQKEREEKRKLYLGGLTKAFDKVIPHR